MVIPRSRSRSIESRYCSRISRASTAPVSSRMRSDSVDLPWSMWAMIEKFRMRARSMTWRAAGQGGVKRCYRGVVAGPGPDNLVQPRQASTWSESTQHGEHQVSEEADQDEREAP